MSTLITITAEFKQEQFLKVGMLQTKADNICDKAFSAPDVYLILNSMEVFKVKGLVMEVKKLSAAIGSKYDIIDGEDVTDAPERLHKTISEINKILNGE